MKGGLLLLVCFQFFICGLSQGQTRCVEGNCVDGWGRLHYANGDEYVGDFVRSQRTGDGHYRYANGDEFTGLYVADEKVYGQFVSKSGIVYLGQFENDRFEGFGTLIQAHGDTLQGHWNQGVLQDRLSRETRLVTAGDGLEKGEKAGRPAVYGVIVGVSDYQGSEMDLRYADDDARSFYAHLRRAMPSETSRGDLRLLTDAQATWSSIASAMRTVYAKAGPDDFLVFFFSGHGGAGHFCPHDYQAHELSHAFIKTTFRESKGRFRLVLADACLSGGISSGGPSTALSSQELMDSRLAVLMSSRSDQSSIESGNLRHGVFTHFLLMGLDGLADTNDDSYITAGELFRFTQVEVSNHTKRAQIPVVYGLNLTKLPLARLR